MFFRRFYYLVQEVIAGQPPRVREWLLKTAIFHRFCASPWDAVFGGGESEDLARETIGEGDGQIEGEATGFIDAFDGLTFIQAAKTV